VAHMPLPPVCRRARQWSFPTMSPRHWIIDCAPWAADGETTLPSTMFVLDLKARRLRRLAPPPSDQSDFPRAHRLPDEIHAMVAANGTIVASVSNHCVTQVYVSTPRGGWKRSDVAPPFGPAFEPEPVCGHLILRSTGGVPWTGGCGGSLDSSGPLTYVRRADGSWLKLPYVLPEPLASNCSSDSQVMAFVAGDALTTARIDRDARKVVRAGVDKAAPVAWLP